MIVAEQDVKRLVRKTQTFTMENMKIECPHEVKDIVEDIGDLFTEKASPCIIDTSPIDTLKLEESYCDLTLETIVNRAHGIEVKNVSHYTELFQSKSLPVRQKPRRKKILVKGYPGKGKSTFAKKLALDWAVGVFKTFSIVFFVSLRFVRPSDKIEDIILNQYPFLKEKERITKQNLLGMLDAFGPRLLLVLDGIDDLAGSQENNDIMKLIKSQKLLKGNILVTSRPHTIKKIQRYFDATVEVAGFVRSQAEKYLVQVLGSTKKAGSILQFYLYDCKDDNIVHFNPLLLSVLCLLVGQGEIFISTVEVYIKLVTVLYFKYVTKNNRPVCRTEFLFLLKSNGRFAWEMLRSGNHFYRRTDVMRNLGPNAFHFALLVGHEDYRLIPDETANIYVTFIHPNIQKFLAAFFCVMSLNDGVDYESLFGAECIQQSPLFANFCLWFLYGIKAHSGKYQSFLSLEKYFEKIDSKASIQRFLILTSGSTTVTQVTLDNISSFTESENMFLLELCLSDFVMDDVLLLTQIEGIPPHARFQSNEKCAVLSHMSSLQILNIRHLHIEKSKAMFQLEFCRKGKICSHTHVLNSDSFVQNGNVFFICRAVRKGTLHYLSYLSLKEHSRLLSSQFKYRNLTQLDCNLIDCQMAKNENLTQVISANCPYLTITCYVYKAKITKTESWVTGKKENTQTQERVVEEQQNIHTNDFTSTASKYPHIPTIKYDPKPSNNSLHPDNLHVSHGDQAKRLFPLEKHSESIFQSTQEKVNWTKRKSLSLSSLDTDANQTETLGFPPIVPFY